MTAPTARLQVKRLRKVFGDTIALRDAYLEVRAGEIHGLLGENGAGKSTLIKIVAGLYPPDAGEVVVDIGDTEDGGVPGADGGVAFIHQDPVAFPDLSVAENIAVLTQYPVRWGRIDWDEVFNRARHALDRVDFAVDVRTEVAALPIAARTLVGIAAALENDANVLILDEPTAGLAAHEVRTLFRLLRELRSRGIAVLLVTHRIDEVMTVCDRVTVLRDGTTIRTADVKSLSEPELVHLIVGYETSPASVSLNAAMGSERLRIAGLVGEGLPGPVTLALRRGEVLGLTGTLEGGHHAIGELLCGLRTISKVDCWVDGSRFSPRTPREVLAAGIRYLPADRNRMGFANQMSLKENLFLNPRGSVGRQRERRAASEILRRFDVRPPDPDAQVSTLSGGNAQKLILGRCFAGDPRVVILTEPTAGVDVGARSSIYDIIRAEAAAGVGVVVISSDFPEVPAVCDRCLVLRRGRVVRELAGDQMTVNQVASAAL